MFISYRIIGLSRRRKQQKKYNQYENSVNYQHLNKMDILGSSN